MNNDKNEQQMLDGFKEVKDRFDFDLGQMPFGKFQGYLFEQLPNYYLQWIYYDAILKQNKFQPNLRRAIEKEIIRRMRAEKPAPIDEFDSLM